MLDDPDSDEDPRAITRGSLGPDAPFARRLKKSIAAAALAPSIHNTQPWIFRVQVTPPGIALWADHSRMLSRADPEGRQLMISCGAAILNLRVELLAQGFGTRTEFFPSPRHPQHVATVLLTNDPSDVDSAQAVLASAIPKRFTSRSAFGAFELPAGLPGRLMSSAAAEGVECSLVTSSQTHTVARLTRNAHRRQLVDTGLLRELAAWTRPESSGARDGVVFEAVGRDSTVNYSAAFPQRDFALGRELGRRDALEIDEEPTLVVLATTADDRTAWLSTGLALERILLTAAKERVMASYLNQSIEVASLRPRLRDALDLAGYPQLVLRIGTPAEYRQPVSPRRPFSDFYRGPVPEIRV